MSDEKWFYGNSIPTQFQNVVLTLQPTHNPNVGLVARTFAKACESLGIEKQAFSCHHKSHITKVILQYVHYSLYFYKANTK
jgi:hypothetical protein